MSTPNAGQAPDPDEQYVADMRPVLDADLHDPASARRFLAAHQRATRRRRTALRAARSGGPR